MTDVVIAADKVLVAERQQISVVQVAQTKNTVTERQRIVVVLEDRPIVQAVIQPASSPLMVVAAGRQGPPGTQGPQGDAVEVQVEIAAVAIGGHRMVVRNTDGKAEYADASTPMHAMQVIGMTTGAADADGQVSVQRSGPITEPSWTWTMNQPVFLGSSGLLTQAVPTPSTAEFSLIVGFPLAETTLLIRQREPIFLGE